MHDDSTAPGAGDDEQRWALVLDPAWQPAAEGEAPPIEAVLGAWALDSDGVTGPFRANPGYVPSGPGSPTDPVDAAVRGAARGEHDEAAVLATMRDALFGIALDEQGAAIVAPAPDDVPSVLVTTAPAHTWRVDAPTWQEITAKDLADSLPAEGVDLLLNPGAPESMRIAAGAFKAVVADTAPVVLGDPPFPA